MTPRCDGCRYWEPTEHPDVVIQLGGGDVGWCVRYPAVVGKGAAEWCGEYVGKEGA